MRLTEWEKSFLRHHFRSTLGWSVSDGELSDARICQIKQIGPDQWQGCGAITLDHMCEKCGLPTREFKSRYLRRFPRLEPEKPAITKEIVERDYPTPFVPVVQGGRPDSNRRRH
jgi:hypothetical protein